MQLDIDHFKGVNEPLDMKLVTKVLKELAERFEKFSTPTDTISRLGGR